MFTQLIPLIFSCAPNATTTETGSPVYSRSVTQARYTFAWNTDGISFLEDGGWLVETDLGYQVELRRGYLTTYTTYLLRCPELAGWGLIGTAYAGHSLTEDPSMLLAPQIEDLVAPQTSQHVSILFEETDYCTVSYLAARADDRAEGQPEDTEMRNVTVYLEGRYTAPGETTPVDFAWSTPLSYGRSEDIDVLSAESIADITLERRLATMFDGIPLDEQSEAVIMDDVLQNLINNINFSTLLD